VFGDASNTTCFADGERYPMLVDSEGIPDFWVTLYVTENLRSNLKQTAIENAIRHIIHLRLWEKHNERDIIAEFGVGLFLSDTDIVSIRDHCLLNTQSLRKWHESSISRSKSKISAIHPTSTQHLPVISKAHAANRLVHIAAFLHFTARTLLRERSDFASHADAINDLKKRIIAQKPKGQSKSVMANDPNAKAPPPEVFEKFMQSVLEDSIDNPFKNPSVRKRNATMFELLFETGMRSGEILALQIGDVDYQSGKVSVVRRHDNPDDPRKRQPVPKTLPRDIPITTILHSEFAIM